MIEFFRFMKSALENHRPKSSSTPLSLNSVHRMTGAGSSRQYRLARAMSASTSRTRSRSSR